jgi:hypothetical protein
LGFSPAISSVADPIAQKKWVIFAIANRTTFELEGSWGKRSSPASGWWQLADKRSYVVGNRLKGRTHSLPEKEDTLC